MDIEVCLFHGPRENSIVSVMAAVLTGQWELQTGFPVLYWGKSSEATGSLKGPGLKLFGLPCPISPETSGPLGMEEGHFNFGNRGDTPPSLHPSVHNYTGYE
ncbi:unnamed protein product [Arctogadus glacialis]